MFGLNTDQMASVPMEDSMETLIEHLLSPLLPWKSTSPNCPSISQQETLAKQMHAVVMLYNFYYRMRFSQIEFLFFQSLCKSSAIINPAIISYFQFMQEKQNIEQISKVSDENLSIVEKAILNACDISLSLFTAFNNKNNNNNNNSNNNNFIESWPIERIAVFLVDEKREKCLIEKDILVKSVYSLIEKEIKREKENISVLNESFHEILENIAVSEVEKKTGIKSSNLHTKHRDLTYSLNKHKSSTRVYIMEYTKKPSKNEFKEIPIEFIIERLKGPVIENGSPPVVTSVVSYYLLLPYIEIIKNWLNNPIIKDLNISQIKETEINKISSMVTKNQISNCSENISMEIENMQNHDKNETFVASQKVSMEIEKMQNNVKNQTNNESQNIAFEIEKMQKNDKIETFIGSQKEPNEIKNNQMDFNNETYNGSQNTPMEIEMTQNDAKNKKAIESQKGPIESEKIQNNFKNEKSNGSKNEPMELEKRQNDPKNKTFNESQIIQMELEKAQKDLKIQALIGSQIVPIELEKTQKDLKIQTFNGSQIVPMEIEKTQNNDKNEISNGSKKEKGINGNEKIDNKRKHIGTNYSYGTSKNESKEVIQHCANTLRPSDETLVKTEIVVFEKKDYESCMQVALKKRDELWTEHRARDDEINQYEMDIHTLITEGEMTPKVESILAKWENPNSNEGSQIQIKKKLKIKTYCQELDDVCRENNLILPRYIIIPSITDGMYCASAIVKVEDFECISSSDLKKSPKEAREHAASRLIEKLRMLD